MLIVLTVTRAFNFFKDFILHARVHHESIFQGHHRRCRRQPLQTEVLSVSNIIVIGYIGKQFVILVNVTGLR